jgi:8-oxo-dGTP diphosphatase
MARAPIHAAGGIVFRGRKRPLVAVVQRSKDERWVLPRGKLKRKEDPQIGARREAVEETGHPVAVHDFVGAITYRTSGRPKVVQFWLMRAAERPDRDLMADIIRVEWLPLKAAVRRLTFPLEKLFLAQVGRRVLRRKVRRKATARKSKASRARPARHKAARKTTRKTKRVTPQTRRRTLDSRQGKRALKRRAR